MMKRTFPLLLYFFVFSMISFADPVVHWIREGEYAYGVEIFNNDILIVDGGGLIL